MRNKTKIVLLQLVVDNSKKFATALERKFGPLAATISYTVGALTLIIPVWLVSTLPKVEKKNSV